MKRILLVGVLAAFMILQAIPAGMGESKRPARWQTVADFKVLKLWESDLGPRWPEIALLQLGKERQKELQSDPLAFLQKYKIFPKIDEVRGYSTLKLTYPRTASYDPWIAAVVHDEATYGGVADFAVREIKDQKDEKDQK